MTGQQLLIVRDDGVVFGDGGHKPFADLGLEIRLPEIPSQDKLWTAPGVKRYGAGARPDPAELFRQVVAVVNRFIDFDRSLAAQQTMCELVACYILATWFLDAFTVIGYLWPNGERGSGKTQLLTVVAELAYLGQVILAGGSYASLRDLADYGATLCFDDAENVMDLKRGDPDKRALLLAGNRRGNTIPVKEPVNGRAWRTRHVQMFCPRLFSAIRLPDPVLASRTIIVPLIRTADPEKANADPLDYRLWPVPRVDLVNSLWALALRYGASLPAYDAQVADAAILLGRNLEPWRAMLAVAHWLTDCGVTALASRMEALAQAYQAERPDLEPPDLTSWVIRALCQHASTASSASTNGESCWEFSSKSIQQELVALLEHEENGPDSQSTTVARVGRILGKLRLTQKPRTGPKVPRVWVLKREELRRWLLSYGMPLPDAIFSDAPPSPRAGTTGCAGTAGTNNNASPAPSNGPHASEPTDFDEGMV